MTTVFQEDIKCSVCGEESNHGIIGSTSTFGSADLDTRPPELERSTIVYDIQYCPHCTYCASSLSGSKDINLDHLKSDAYKEILSNTKTPETARYYLAASHLAEITNNLRFAFWHAIRATWICDDSGDDDIATECRNRTIRLGQQAIASSMIISDQEGSTELIMTDLLRRVGKFDEARLIIQDAVNLYIDDFMKSIFSYQEKLISKDDRSAHLIDEASAK